MRHPKLAIFLMSWLFTSVASCAEESFVQQDCVTEEDYLSVWFTIGGVNDEGTPYQSIQFNKDGLLLRVKPIYYAPDWKNIGEIRYTKHVSKETGLLTVEVIEEDGDRYTETAGVITNQCWMSIGEFVKNNDIEVNLVARGD